jgi:hypothetical protein
MAVRRLQSAVQKVVKIRWAQIRIRMGGGTAAKRTVRSRLPANIFARIDIIHVKVMAIHKHFHDTSAVAPNVTKEHAGYARLPWVRGHR